MQQVGSKVAIQMPLHNAEMQTWSVKLEIKNLRVGISSWNKNEGELEKQSYLDEASQTVHIDTLRDDPSI